MSQTPRGKELRLKSWDSVKSCKVTDWACKAEDKDEIVVTLGFINYIRVFDLFNDKIKLRLWHVTSSVISISSVI